MFLKGPLHWTDCLTGSPFVYIDNNVWSWHPCKTLRQHMGGVTFPFANIALELTLPGKSEHRASSTNRFLSLGLWCNLITLCFVPIYNAYFLALGGVGGSMFTECRKKIMISATLVRIFTNALLSKCVFCQRLTASTLKPHLVCGANSPCRWIMQKDTNRPSVSWHPCS